jgi:hypothetical protein
VSWRPVPVFTASLLGASGVRIREEADSQLPLLLRKAGSESVIITAVNMIAMEEDARLSILVKVGLTVIF